MKRKKIAAAVLLACTTFSPLVLGAPPALAAPPDAPITFPKGHSVFGFNYKVTATAFVKRGGITLAPPPGVFKGAIDLDTGKLKGGIKIPPSVFAQDLGGGFKLVAMAAMEQVKQVTGTVNLSTFKIKSTSVFNIHMLTMYLTTPLDNLPRSITLPGGIVVQLPPLPNLHTNLVGSQCYTASPVTVTIGGTAHIGLPSTFQGVFTIPGFVNCKAMTALINQQVPGPGNIFKATAEPLD